MDGSLLFPILKSIPAEKKSDLIQFLGSAYCNAGAHPERQIRLVQHVFETLDQEGANLPEHPAVFLKVFGDQPFDTKKLEKLRSTTLAQVRRFFAEEHRRNTEPEVLEQLRFAAYLRVQGQYDLFMAEIKKIEKQINKMPESIEKMHCLFLKEYEIGYYKSIETNKRDDSNIPNIVRAIDHFYLSHRLHYELSFVQQQQFSSLVKDNALFNLFPVEAFGALYEKKPILIELYHQLSCFFRANSEDEASANAILSLIKENEAVLSKNVLRECLTCLINYYTKLVNQGKTAYYSTLFEIQKRSVENGFVYYLDKIHMADFQAVVTIGLRLNELDWTWNFINNNKNKILNKNGSVEMLRYIYASYYFQKKEYKNVARYLKETFDEQQFKTASRILELKLMYELQDADLPKKLQAAKVYFFRDAALPLIKKTAVNKFLDYIRQITIPGTLQNKTRTGKIWNKLKAEPYVAEKPWLMEVLSRKFKLEQDGTSDQIHSFHPL